MQLPFLSIPPLSLCAVGLQQAMLFECVCVCVCVWDVTGFSGLPDLLKGRKCPPEEGLSMSVQFSSLCHLSSFLPIRLVGISMCKDS